jgi:hypothetical protein
MYPHHYAMNDCKCESDALKGRKASMLCMLGTDLASALPYVFYYIELTELFGGKQAENVQQQYSHSLTSPAAERSIFMFGPKLL